VQVKVNHVDSQGPRSTKNCDLVLDLEKDRNLFFADDHFGSRCDCEERKTDDLAVTHYNLPYIIDGPLLNKMKTQMSHLCEVNLLRNYQVDAPA